MTDEQLVNQAFAAALVDAVDNCKSMSDLDIHVREVMESKGFFMIDEHGPNDRRNYAPAQSDAEKLSGTLGGEIDAV